MRRSLNGLLVSSKNVGTMFVVDVSYLAIAIETDFDSDLVPFVIIPPAFQFIPSQL